MSRQFTQEEARAFVAAESELRKAGLKVEDPEVGNHNAEIVRQFFEQNPATVVTQESINSAVFGELKESLVWKSEDEIAFERIWATLNRTEQEAFNTRGWRPRRLINNDKNNTIILKYLKESQRYEINHRTLQQAAADRIPAQLEWQPAPEQPSGRGHKSDGAGFLPDEKSSRYRGGKLNHAYQEPGSRKPATPQVDASEARWQEMAEALRGNTHSKNAELERIHGSSWRETYELRKKALNANPAIVTKMGAA